MKENLLTHFRNEEHAFVERVLDWIRRVREHHQEVITAFLDPREQFILTSLVRRVADVLVHVDGGYADAERCRVRIAPDYLYLQEDSLPLAFIRLVADTRLEHREVLGALLGLGIGRQVLGDILPQSTFTDVIAAKEMKDYLLGNLTKVGRKAIIISEIARNQLVTEQQNGIDRQITVSSLRLDTIVASICRLSRSKANELVRLGRCKVNWQTIERSDYLLTTGDMLSIRGYGRIRLKDIRDVTKKGKYPILFSHHI